MGYQRRVHGVRFIMENGAKGCEVIISGKLRAQRAKVMKFRDGYLISTGEPKRHYISAASRHVMMRQGVLGVRVKIMLAHDPEGKMGAKFPLPSLEATMEKPSARSCHATLGPGHLMCRV